MSPNCCYISGLVRPPPSHLIGLTRPTEMRASADAEDQRGEGGVPQT